MTFGINQLRNPTPTNINLIARIATVFFSTFLAWMQSTTIIPTHASSVISGIIGLLLALINGIAPLFGQEIKTDMVPTSQVSAIDTEQKPMNAKQT